MGMGPSFKKLSQWLPGGFVALSLLVFGLQFGGCLTPCAQAAPNVTPMALTESYAQPRLSATPDRPQLLQGLMAPDPKSDQALRARLNSLFPTPLKEQSLSEALSKQGFRVMVDQDEATFSESIYPCLYLWRITWNEDAQHNVRALRGKARTNCV
jgi:hypothetical protein